MDINDNNTLPECVAECQGTWVECVKEALQMNSVPVAEFRGAVCDMLISGRGKNRNIFICDPANCGKTFLLKLLHTLFKTFWSPANDRFAWAACAQVDFFFLNDFWWHRELIPWEDMLLLLEGEAVHFPTPPNHFKENVCLTRDTPVFVTGKSFITFQGPYSTCDLVEDEMMTTLWKVFRFTWQIPIERQKDIPPCPKCFSDLVLA